MDPKRKRSGSEDREALDLTLTQDIQVPFDEDEVPEAVEESFHQEDFEAP